jgi:hypothetical protein
MIKKASNAPTYKRFWQLWNPVYHYFLLFYIYKPLRKFLPRFIAVITTFFLCGILHDILALSIYIALRRWPRPLVGLWFIFLGIFVSISSLLEKSGRKNKIYHHPNQIIWKNWGLTIIGLVLAHLCLFGVDVLILFFQR